MRIVFVGPPGAGKSYWSRKLSQQLQIPRYELDEMYWLPDWQKHPDGEFTKSLAVLLAKDSYVIDGQYPELLDVLLKQRPLNVRIIVCHVSKMVSLARVFKRTLKRYFFRETICNGNFETASNLWKRDGMLRYAYRIYSQKNQEVEIYRKHFDSFTIQNSKDYDILLQENMKKGGRDVKTYI